MSDINRIDDFCKRLAEAWKNNSDWRFFQLIDNVQHFALKSDGFILKMMKQLKLLKVI